MKILFGIITLLFLSGTPTFGQEKNEIKMKPGKVASIVYVPVMLKIALSKKYPHAAKVIWEKEHQNYKANWSGRPGENNSVLFTAGGQFIEMVKTIAVNELPEPVILYINKHYSGSKIHEAHKIADTTGKTSYEADITLKVLHFDENGKFIGK